jgi:hypothetical protein
MLIVAPVLLIAANVIRLVAKEPEPVPVQPEPEPVELPEFYDNVVDFTSARERILERRY